MEKALSAKEEKVKYTKTINPDSHSIDYFMRKPNTRNEWVKVSVGTKYEWGSIEDELFEGDLESTQQEFEQAFNTVSNRFRTAVFNDNTATRTETNDGNQTTIEIKPTK